MTQVKSRQFSKKPKQSFVDQDDNNNNIGFTTKFFQNQKVASYLSLPFMLLIFVRVVFRCVLLVCRAFRLVVLYGCRRFA